MILILRMTAGKAMVGNMEKKQNWMYISIGAIILSLLSLFLPVITYQSARTGIIGRYNIIKILDTRELNENVFSEYTGEFLRGMSDSDTSMWAVLISIIGVTAIVLAFVGIKSMTKQYESETPFRLAICGLIGTAIPSIVLLVLYLYSMNQYEGTMHLGAYIIITPIAMVPACLTVTSRHRMTQEEARLQKEAQLYIRPAGDLPIIEHGGAQYYGQ